ncbi:auxin response factor 1, partial [Trifolium medium]|nr:auxin response factor 1 [Trifolium medium]
MASSTQSSQKFDDDKKPQLVLFGQKILTEQQISGDRSSDGNADKMSNFSD